MLRYFRVKDFKVFEDLKIPKELLHGDLPIYLTGENGKGKTSLAQAIEALFKGIDDVRVRIGTDHSEIMLGAGDLDFRRSKTRGGRNKLTITKDGEPQRRPQEEADNMCHALAFSPRRFVGMQPKEQAREFLRYLDVPIPEGFVVVPNLDPAAVEPIEYAEKAEAHYMGARREAKKQLTAALSKRDVLAGEIPEGWEGMKWKDPAEREKAIDARMATLQEYRGEIKAWRDGRREREQKLRTADEFLTKAKVELAEIPSAADAAARCDQKKLEEVTVIDSEIKRLEGQIAQLMGKRVEVAEHWDERKRNSQATFTKKREELERSISAQESDVAEHRKALDGGAPYNDDEIENELDALKTERAELASDRSYEKLHREVTDWDQRATAIELDVERYDEYVKEARRLPALMLEGVELVEGLSIDEKYQLIYDGVPLAECEESRQELLCIDIMAKIQEHYAIRIMCIDGTGALGAERRKALDERLNEIAHRWNVDEKSGACKAWAIFVTEIPRPESGGLPIESLSDA